MRKSFTEVTAVYIYKHGKSWELFICCGLENMSSKIQICINTVSSIFKTDFILLTSKWFLCGLKVSIKVAQTLPLKMSLI